jgi:homoserine O-acetyltransferase
MQHSKASTTATPRDEAYWPPGSRAFRQAAPFPLESGHELPELTLAYHTYGRLNATRDNVIWICHALTANSDAADWWAGLVGEGKLFDPGRHCIVCVNMLGSCYGSTGPPSYNPATERPYYSAFPLVTIRDMVRSQELLRQHLGIERIRLMIGGSMGGQQGLEWAVMAPERVEQLVALATNAQHSPWGIAFNETQRLAIEADPSFLQDRWDGGAKGMAAARATALLSYRSYEIFEQKQQDPDANRRLTQHRACSYQRYQGEKLVRRFNAHSYWILSRAMDSHHLARDRAPMQAVLADIRARTLVISLASDLLFPAHEQRYLATHIPGAMYTSIDSPYGHDGFLIEAQAIQEAILQHLDL